MGQGKSRVTVGEYAGIKAAVTRHNKENPDNQIFLATRTVERDGAGDSTHLAFTRVPFIAGAKRGRKPKKGTDDAPRVGDVMPDLPAK